MNWLAHVYLSEPDTDFRLGNLLADLIKEPAVSALGASFLRGVKRHQAIDAFTDFHPVIQRSRARISGKYRLLKGIMVDVFFDHLLAKKWPEYSSESLAKFTASFYAEIQKQPRDFPPDAALALEQMILDDRLSSYREVAGVEQALHRVAIRLSTRLGKPVDFDGAIGELTNQFSGFENDFDEFFPLLRTHVSTLVEL